MSREFGSYHAGYFHYQMETAADDCLSGHDELTRLWGAFLREFAHVAYAIASSEANDSGPDYPIFETMERLPELKRRLAAIEAYTAPYRAVAEAAVRRHIEDKN